MNAMEMMMKAALDRLMENIPPETLEQVQQIGHFVKRLDQRLERLEANQQRAEANQRLIMDALHINSEHDDGSSGQRQLGSEIGSGAGSEIGTVRSEPS